MYTAEQLAIANAACKTTAVKDKPYVEVNQRIKAFRSVCPGGCILTEMVSNEGGVCVFRATVYDEEMRMLGTGTAYENEKSSFINKTSYIENCETSAVGRALGMCGFGIDTSIASAEEVGNAILNQNREQPHQKPQERPQNPRKALIAKLNELGMDVNVFAREHGLTAQSDPEYMCQLLAELEGSA